MGTYIATGIAPAAWVNFGLSNIPQSSIAWRLPLAIPLTFTILVITFAFLFFKIPALASLARSDIFYSRASVASDQNG